MTSFAIAIPGRPLLVNFQPDGQYRWTVDIPDPGSISDICFFLTSQLPQQDVGISIYYNLAGWQFIGAVSNTKPTVIINPGWSLNPNVNREPVLKVGIALEPAAEIVPKLETCMQLDFRKNFARKVALNLFRFLESFNIQGFPVAALDKWFLKFEEKFQRDPNFVLSTE
jgi:hypothetical protein